jgi:hypothetical protein
MNRRRRALAEEWIRAAELLDDPSMRIRAAMAAHGLRALTGVAVQGRSIPPPAEASEKEPHKTTLYRHFAGNGRLLYVGVSLSAISRLSDHRTSRWFDQIVDVEVEYYPTREAALAAEREAIRTENPLYNIAGKVAT